MKRLFVFLIVLMQINMFANGKMGDSIKIENGYIRLMPPMMPMTAAFMKLTNTSLKDIVLTKFESDLAIFTELHTSIQNEDGTSSMKHLKKLTIKANSSVMLQRGGKHIMFMRLKNKLKLNDSYYVIFYFADGSSKKITMKVEKI